MDSNSDSAGCRLYAPPFVPPRDPLPFPLGTMLKAVEKKLGGRMDGLRVLARYPKALVGAGLLESFIAHEETETPLRLLALVRLTVSYAVSCPFCVDLNGHDFRKIGISAEELEAIRRDRDPETVASLSEAERAAIAFAAAVSATPVRVTEKEASRLSAAVGERGFVIVAATAAQVNFWARLLQGLGAPPAGIASDPETLAVSRYINPRA